MVRSAALRRVLNYDAVETDCLHRKNEDNHTKWKSLKDFGWHGPKSRSDQ